MEENYNYNFKDSPAYSLIQNSPFYNLIKVFTKAYSSKIREYTDEEIKTFFDELKNYILKYTGGNLIQIISIVLIMIIILLIGLSCCKIISWIQCLVLLMLMILVSIIIFLLYYSFTSYKVSSELNKIQNKIMEFSDSKITKIGNMIENF